MMVRSGVDELRGDPDRIARSTDASLEHVRDTELTGDLPQRLRALLVVHRGGTRDHLQCWDRRELRDDLLGDAVAEVLVVATRAQVEEGQHGDGALGRWRRRPESPRE